MENDKEKRDQGQKLAYEMCVWGQKKLRHK